MWTALLCSCRHAAMVLLPAHTHIFPPAFSIWLANGPHGCMLMGCMPCSRSPTAHQTPAPQAVFYCQSKGVLQQLALNLLACVAHLCMHTITLQALPLLAWPRSGLWQAPLPNKSLAGPEICRAAFESTNICLPTSCIKDACMALSPHDLLGSRVQVCLRC